MKGNWMRRLRGLMGGVAILSVATLVGCAGGEEEAARSIEEIHESEGVPVTARPAEPTEFRTFLSFTGTLSGAEESTATSMLSDEVASVLYQVGEFVEQGSPVVLFPPDNPTLNYEQARVSFESARQAFERVSRLYEEEGVSRQNFDDARTQFELARANWESVQQMAQVAAPISGYITRVNVFESDNVRPGDPLFTVSSYEELRTTVWLSDREAGIVQVGRPALAIWQDRTLEGEVIQVDLSMDRERRAFAARLRFDNPELRVQSGVSADVEITTSLSEALIVSDSEVRRDSEGVYLFVIEDGTARRRRIATGRRQGLLMEVTDGLEEGEMIVTRGIDQLDDGAGIRIIEQEPTLLQP
ncbi:MAG: efflux RND transporter periplasmic adaptor subunit [Alkalispirochaetaceae bacterium]